MSSKWYVRSGGQELGPYPTAALKELASKGKITANTQVRPDDGAWVAAGKVKGLLPSPPIQQATTQRNGVAGRKVVGPSISEQQAIDWLKADEATRKNAAEEPTAVQGLSPHADEIKYSSVPPPLPSDSAQSPKAEIAGQWFYTQAGGQCGPVALEELKSLCASGRVRSTDQVWISGMPGWIPASQVEELKSVCSSHKPHAPPRPPALPKDSTKSTRTQVTEPFCGIAPATRPQSNTMMRILVILAVVVLGLGTLGLFQRGLPKRNNARCQICGYEFRISDLEDHRDVSGWLVERHCPHCGEKEPLLCFSRCYEEHHGHPTLPH